MLSLKPDADVGPFHWAGLIARCIDRSVQSSPESGPGVVSIR